MNPAEELKVRIKKEKAIEVEQVEKDRRTAELDHWREKKICSVRREVFVDMAACQEGQFGSWYKVMPLFEKIVGSLEPKAQQIEGVRKQHAKECIDYPDLLLK